MDRSNNRCLRYILTKTRYEFLERDTTEESKKLENRGTLMTMRTPIPVLSGKGVAERFIIKNISSPGIHRALPKMVLQRKMKPPSREQEMSHTESEM